ncbi:MAG: NAD(P)H-hydrate dehydratase [Gammaproteobacteria bacterium]|nr:NAD(P)H-hydrate dehydratase [Gammaproteobacteria bacterium]
MSSLPQFLYTTAQCQELDHIAMTEAGLDGGVLMQRAGAAAFHCLRRQWPRAKHIVVMCGRGNNGGDGYVLAQLCCQAGMTAHVIRLDEPKTQDARLACDQAVAFGVSMSGMEEPFFDQADVVVDAIFGTGLLREVTGEWRAVIEWTNTLGKPVLSLDVPSGLNADTGECLGVAIKAQMTVSFIGLKRGMFTGVASEYCGRVMFSDLEVAAWVFDRVPTQVRRMVAHTLRVSNPQRRRYAHKGDAGHVVVVGGDLGMPGAVQMTGMAAYRSGAGQVTVATRAHHSPQISAACPELMVHGVEEGKVFEAIMQRGRVLAVGPGLGRGDWGQRLWDMAMDSDQTKVVDADGLYHLAKNSMRQEDWVLTPHPKEAARLLGCHTHEVQSNRFAAVREIANRYGGVCVLKGAGSLVASSSEVIALCDRGNPGMATAGMGDVLTGVIAALIVQGVSLRQAAELGVYLHAQAADIAAQDRGEIGLMATDLLPGLRTLVNSRPT